MTRINPPTNEARAAQAARDRHDRIAAETLDALGIEPGNTTVMETGIRLTHASPQDLETWHPAELEHRLATAPAHSRIEITLVGFISNDQLRTITKGLTT